MTLVTLFGRPCIGWNPPPVVKRIAVGIVKAFRILLPCKMMSLRSYGI